MNKCGTSERRVKRCSGVKKERHRERRAQVNKRVLQEHHADVQQPQLIDAFKALISVLFLALNLVHSFVLPVSKPASQVLYIWLEDWVLILKVREKVRAPNSTDDFQWNMKLEPILFCCCFSLVLFQDKILLSYFFKLKLKYFIAAFCKVKYLLLGGFVAFCVCCEMIYFIVYYF